MAIKLIKNECPHCGASLDVDITQNTVKCDYCGVKFTIDKDSTLSPEQSAQNEKDNKSFLQGILALLFVVFICGLMIFAEEYMDDAKKNKMTDEFTEIREQAKQSGLVMAEKSSDSIGDSGLTKFKEAVITLESWGFTNVKAVPLEDFPIILPFYDGMIAEITIEGHSFSAGDCFEKDAPVVITFHSKPGAEGYSSKDN